MPTQEDIILAQQQQAADIDDLTQQPIAGGLSPNDLYDIYNQSLAAQKQVLNDTKKEVKDIAKRKTQVDLTPVAALVDAWTGSNFSRISKPEFTETDKQNLLMTYKRLISQQQNEISKSQIAIANALGKNTMMAKAPRISPSQWVARGYGKRAEEADKNIEQVLGQGVYDPTTSGSYAFNWLTPEVIKSEDRKLLEQAQRQFVNALLRRESGAAIAPSEFKNYSAQYFPQPGDTDEVLEQKAQSRKTAIEGLKLEAGQAWNAPSSEGVPEAPKMTRAEAPKMTREAKIAKLRAMGY